MSVSICKVKEVVDADAHTALTVLRAQLCTVVALHGNSAKVSEVYGRVNGACIADLAQIIKGLIHHQLQMLRGDPVGDADDGV